MIDEAIMTGVHIYYTHIFIMGPLPPSQGEMVPKYNTAG